MSSKRTLFALKASLVLALSLSVNFCAKQNADSSPTISAIHEGTYMGKGSVWTYQLHQNGAFEASRKDNYDDQNLLLSVSGSYSRLDSGYYLFTVADASGENAPKAGDQAIGFSVPGVVLIVKPLDSSSDEILTMPAVGDCTLASSEYNWVKARVGEGNGDLSNAALWGHVHIGFDELAHGQDLLMDGTISADEDYAQVKSCKDGVARVLDHKGNGGGYITITKSGIGIVTMEHEDSPGDAILTIPQDKSLSKDSFAGKTFMALVFLKGDGVNAYEATFAADGSATVKKMKDPVANTFEDQTADLQGLQIESGDFAGHVKFEVIPPKGESQKALIRGAATMDLAGTGRTFLAGTGYSVDSPTESFSVILLEK